MKVSCKSIEEAVVESRQGVFFPLGGRGVEWEPKTPHRKSQHVTDYYTGPRI